MTRPETAQALAKAQQLRRRAQDIGQRLAAVTAQARDLPDVIARHIAAGEDAPAAILEQDLVEATRRVPILEAAAFKAEQAANAAERAWALLAAPEMLPAGREMTAEVEQATRALVAALGRWSRLSREYQRLLRTSGQLSIAPAADRIPFEPFPSLSLMAGKFAGALQEEAGVLVPIPGYIPTEGER